MQKQGAEPEQHHKKVKVISRARGGEQIPSGRLRENLIPEYGREFVGTCAQTDPMSPALKSITAKAAPRAWMFSDAGAVTIAPEVPRRRVRRYKRSRRYVRMNSERRKNQKLGIRRKGLRLDATQPGAANTTMIERAGVASSFVDSRAGDRERRSGICPKEERTYSAPRCI